MSCLFRNIPKTSEIKAELSVSAPGYQNILKLLQ